MNEKQMSSAKMRRLEDIDDGRPYYLKIDHCQILPPNKQGEYLILTIYHVEYLK